MLRSQNFGGRTWSRLYAVAASCAVVSLTLVASCLRPMTVTAQETRTKPGPAVAAAVSDQDLLKLIPPTVIEAVVDIDVQALLKSPLAEPLLAAAPDALNWLPFNINTLERAIVLVSDQQSNPSSQALLLLQFAEGTTLPIDVHATDAATATPQQEFAEASRKINARTLAVGGNEALRNMIGVLPTDNFYRPLLERQGNKAIRIAGRMDLVKENFTKWSEGFSRSGDSPLWLFAPLWEKVSTVSLSVDLNDKLQLQGQLDSGDPQAVVDTLSAAKTLASNYLTRMQDTRTKTNVPMDPMERMLLTTAVSKGKELLGSMRFETNEPSSATFTAQIEAGSEAGLAVILPAIAASRKAALRSQSANNLKQLLLALHNYHDTYKHFPPVIVRDATSGTERSWRVEILPYLEGGAELYNQYRQDEAWDSPANLKVLKQMPKVFSFPGSVDSTDTPYQAIASNDGGLTLTPAGMPPTFAVVTDGSSNTVFLVETKPMVPWTKPVDVTDADQVREVAVHTGGFHAGFGDGSVRFIAESINPTLWHALTTRSGREVTAQP